MKLIDWFKEKKELVDENSKIRKAKNVIENNLSTMQQNYNEISTKYIKMLEQKSEKFDLYLEYQEKCIELTNEKKELKKELAGNSETINELNNTIAELNEDIKKLDRKVKRLEKKNEQSA